VDRRFQQQIKENAIIKKFLSRDLHSVMTSMSNTGAELRSYSPPQREQEDLNHSQQPSVSDHLTSIRVTKRPPSMAGHYNNDSIETFGNGHQPHVESNGTGGFKDLQTVDETVSSQKKSRHYRLMGSKALDDSEAKSMQSGSMKRRQSRQKSPGIRPLRNRSGSRDQNKKQALSMIYSSSTKKMSSRRPSVKKMRRKGSQSFTSAKGVRLEPTHGITSPPSLADLTQ